MLEIHLRCILANAQHKYDLPCAVGSTIEIPAADLGSDIVISSIQSIVASLSSFVRVCDSFARGDVQKSIVLRLGG